jgi:hypothetical protein
LYFIGKAKAVTVCFRKVSLGKEERMEAQRRKKKNI